ncbi:MAG TPA: sulfatase-like hydrolase/transferase, partial [Holophagaceae bacterium]|nr:sulfatase-like hydrolase/transferase [Holophagaceae bacterium]
YLGGTGDWAQIRASLKNNLRSLDVQEEAAFKSPKVDVWGVADADFLHECGAFLAQDQPPFFALVQTAGNHPPFTIPPHLPFQQAHPGQEALSKAGFASDEEYNALRLMDWSVGRFFDEIRDQPWFRNTVFVLYGDHGVPRGNFDRRFGDLALISHHVPFLIYAPGLIKPGRVTATASLMDVAPTVMSLLGRRVELRTLGRDALDPRFQDSGTAFTFTPFVSPSSYGLLRGDRYLTVRPGSPAQLFDLQDPKGLDISAQHPDETRELAELARATRAWSRYLLSHNKP